MTKKSKWVKFPYEEKAYHYEGAALKKHWSQLHGGDQEPFPSAEWVKGLAKKNVAVAASLEQIGSDPDEVSVQLQDAWRHYHEGDFQGAVEGGSGVGLLGTNVVNKATAIYATYLEKKPEAKLDWYQDVVTRAEEAREQLPDQANSHYLYAYALGRYSQSISVLKALGDGLGGKIKDALDHTVELAPRHAEAHAALGTYNAEIVAKVGGLIGNLTYGASQERALEHYQEALKLHPSSPIVHIEYANGLLLLFGKKRLDEATKLYVEATKMKPSDAMERLDIEAAKARIETD